MPRNSLRRHHSARSRLDRLQRELGDGPCINAARYQSIVRIEDTGREERWPEFSAEAVRLNVRSMLCVPLWIDERSLGALSLYAGQAKGILMERHSITADAAFGVLSRVSQAENMKLAEIAATSQRRASCLARIAQTRQSTALGQARLRATPGGSLEFAMARPGWRRTVNVLARGDA